MLEVLKKATEPERHQRPKIDEIRLALGLLRESVSDKLSIVFTITPNFQQNLLEKIPGSHPLKIKRYLEGASHFLFSQQRLAH